MDTNENVSKMLGEKGVGLKRDLINSADLCFRENLVTQGQDDTFIDI